MPGVVSVAFDDLAVGDRVVIRDSDHEANGAYGKVYWLDQDSRIVSVSTDGCVDVWEGHADGLEKVVAEFGRAGSGSNR